MRAILQILCFMGLVVGLGPSMLHAGGSQPRSVIRIHVEEGGSTSGGQVAPINLAKPRKQIYIRRFADLNENHVLNMQRIKDGRVMVNFNETGKRILEVITSQNLGRIIVVIFNNKVIYSPTIDIPLRNGVLLLPSNIGDDEIVGMQNTIKEIMRKKHFR